MYPRIRALKSLIESLPFEAFLVCKHINRVYLTEKSSSEGWLFMTPKRTYFLTDPRYESQAKSELRGIDVRIYSEKRPFYDVFKDLIHSSRVKRIGFDPRHASVAFFKKLRRCCPPKVRFIPKEGCVEELRMVKTPAEISRIRQALKYNFKCLKYLKSSMKAGLTEKGLFDCFRKYVQRQHLDFSFNPIIASGPNSSYPHAPITNRRLKANDHVMVDLGIDWKGYKSDLTRIFFLGKIPALIRETAEIVRVAQKKAIAGIHPGMRAYEVDQLARKYLLKKGLDKYFCHSLGHGVGIEIHEAPMISPTSKIILKPGMVFTIEPGVYIPGRFGVRMEDMVLVTIDGCELLSG